MQLLIEEKGKKKEKKKFIWKGQLLPVSVFYQPSNLYIRSCTSETAPKTSPPQPALCLLHSPFVYYLGQKKGANMHNFFSTYTAVSVVLQPMSHKTSKERTEMTSVNRLLIPPRSRNLT